MSMHTSSSSRLTPTLLICLLGAAIVVGALFLPARETAAPTPSAPPPAAVIADAPVDVTIEAFAFSALGTLQPGQELRVTNNDSVPHTLTADDGSFDTGLLQPGEQAVISAPANAGTFSFLCEVHPSMTGVLDVGA